MSYIVGTLGRAGLATIMAGALLAGCGGADELPGDYSPVGEPQPWPQTPAPTTPGPLPGPTQSPLPSQPPTPDPTPTPAPPTCSAATCEGCCTASGMCKSGLSQDFCGAGGARCNSCDTGESCVERACSAEPEEPAAPSSYELTLVGADIGMAGVALCAGGIGGLLDTSCDVYAKIEVGGQKVQSSKISNNNHPKWNEVIAEVSGATTLKVSLQDADTGPDTPLGSGGYSLDPSNAAGAISVPIKLGGLKTATVTFKLAPSK